MKTRILALCAALAGTAVLSTPCARAKDAPKLSNAELEANARSLTEVEAAQTLDQPAGRELRKLLAGKWEGKSASGERLEVVFADTTTPTMQITEGKQSGPAVPFGILTVASPKQTAGRIGSFSKETMVLIHRKAADNAPESIWRIVALDARALKLEVQSGDRKGVETSFKRAD